MHTLNLILSVIQIIVAVGLIYIVAIQQSKTEGLGGTIGGRVMSTFKGKASFDDRLTEMTKYFSIAFFVTSILAAVTANR